MAATREQVKDVYKFLKESFGNEINGMPKLEIDQKTQKIKGVFKSGKKLFNFDIDGRTGKHSYKLIKRRDSMAYRTDAKKCEKGVQCGGTCIEGKDSCNVGFSEAAKGAWNRAFSGRASKAALGAALATIAGIGVARRRSRTRQRALPAGRQQRALPSGERQQRSLGGGRRTPALPPARRERLNPRARLARTRRSPAGRRSRFTVDR